MKPIVSSISDSMLGRYKVLEKLGQGATATVYRAEDPTLGRQVAIKVMHPFFAERSEAGGRFEREAKAVAALRHPNVLQLYDYAPAAADHPAYLVMELLTGPSLHRFLLGHGSPLGEIAAMMGLRVAQALAAAHKLGIVHRDVKPENVMFDSHRVVLCDFGIARLVAAEGMTATGAVVGSPAYMSPEQASSGTIDARSDQFSLGSLLYQLATGALPFSGATPLATMARIVLGEHVPPSAKNPRMPPYVERVIERCLQVEPARRFASADALVEALREGLAADGFVDIDAELAAYLRDPPSYNAAVEARIVVAARAQAEAARGRGETARVLAAANRLLAWRPQDAQAVALASAATARSWRRVLVAAGALAIVAGGVTAWRLHASRPPPSISPSPPAAPRPGETKPAPAPLPPPPATVTPPATMTAPPTPTKKARKHVPEIDPPPSLPLPDNTPPATTIPATPPPPVAPVAAPVQPAIATARLTVLTAPWCDLRVDGTPHGRTPQTLTLPAGRHHVECANPAAGRSLVKDVELGAGDDKTMREQLYAPVRVLPQLVEVDAFSVDDQPIAVGVPLVAPGRHRFTFYRGGHALSTHYIDVPPEGCVLVNKPQPACQKL